MEDCEKIRGRRVCSDTTHDFVLASSDFWLGLPCEIPG